MPRVRELLVARMRAYACEHDLVMEGRDIGSVVFPETPYKFYIDASPISARNAGPRRGSRTKSPRAIGPIPLAVIRP